MPTRHVHLETLIGRKVFDPSGRCAGRIEEVLADSSSGQCLITEFHLGGRALVAERLNIPSLAHTLLAPLGADKFDGARKVPWQLMDLSDPARPRLTCSIEELDRR